MESMLGCVTATAVASIYLLWRAYYRDFLRRERTRHERVAYMLWTMANQLP